MSQFHKGGTRIFKKSSPNGKITIYLGKRDFYDHLTHVDPIEGVVLVDPDYVRHRKVFISLLGAFRFGRDDTDMLGMAYYSDLYLSTRQVYPSNADKTGVLYTSDVHRVVLPTTFLEPPSPTRLQERLIRKLGAHAYPFFFQLPAYSASSVFININASDSNKPCRMDYELKAYVAENKYDVPAKRNSVRMIIRKLTQAPEKPGPQPSAEVVRDFLMSLGSLRVEASLDKQIYRHGETVCVNVLVDNNSSKTVKKIKISIVQCARVSIRTTIAYKCTVAEILSDEGFPISPSQTGWCKVYRLCPTLVNNRDKLGLAIDGDLKHEYTNLASSSISPPTHVSVEPVGISVQYKVKIRLTLGFGLSDVCLELPFLLTHPNESDQDHMQPGDAFSENCSVDPLKTISSKNGGSFPGVLQSLHQSNGAGSNHCVVTSRIAQVPLAEDCNGYTSNTASTLTSATLPVRFVGSLSPPTGLSSMTVPTFAHHVAYPWPTFPVADMGFGSSKSDRRMSVAATQSTASEDDLLFEDFARFRIRTTVQSNDQTKVS